MVHLEREAMQRQTYDVAVIGAGIVGLAVARMAAMRGHRVLVCDRHSAACGASVRNFGFVCTIGMKPGLAHERALATRLFWDELIKATGIWHAPYGSLGLAYREDEWAVMNEFALSPAGDRYAVEVVSPRDVIKQNPAVRSEGLKGGLFCHHDLIVDPRQAMPAIAAYLNQSLGVCFRFDTPIVGIRGNELTSASEEMFAAQRIVVCSGAELDLLLPCALSEAGVTRTKLQMMRTESCTTGTPLFTPALWTGLSLRRFAPFANCSGLPALCQRIAEETPALNRWGIHVAAVLNGCGEIVIGDSHTSDEPFDHGRIDAIDRLILRAINEFLNLQDIRIASRWTGVYTNPPEGALEYVIQPQPQVGIITGVNTGMTTAFAAAREWCDTLGITQR